MLTVKKPEPVQSLVSGHPLAMATLTMTMKNGKKELVEWTEVRKVVWKSNDRSYIRHVLKPILAEHIGPPEWLGRTMKITGLGLDLKKYDIGCSLTVDVPLNPLPGEAPCDFHVKG
jgi:hypothetical protein